MARKDETPRREGGASRDLPGRASRVVHTLSARLAQSLIACQTIRPEWVAMLAVAIASEVGHG